MGSEPSGAPLDRVDWNDPFSYIREMYGVPAREGSRVTFIGAPATVVGTEGHYLVIHPDDDREPIIVHPTWRIEYADA